METVFHNIKVNDKITTYCSGQEVKGKIVEIGRTYFKVKHEPVNWGGEYCSETIVKESSSLQKQFYSDITPVAFKDGIVIRLK